MKRQISICGIILAFIMLFFTGFGGITVKADTGVETPKNLKVYNPMIDTIYLKWKEVPGASGYYVYFSTEKNGSYKIARAVSTNGVVISGMADRQKYYFKVKAFDAIGTVSEDSSIVSGKNKICGIDVSKHNGIIDWAKVKSQIDFAILRVGYGDNIATQDDTMWTTNAKACTDNKIPFGVYIYSYATSTNQAKSEADHVLRLVKNYKFKYPVFFDMEDASTTWTSATLKGDMAEKFCNTITDAGYKVGIYANTNWFTNILTDARFNNWDKWVAQYNSQCTYTGKYMMWQYSSTGSVDGINGNVDMNYLFTGTNYDLSHKKKVNINEGGAVIGVPKGMQAEVLSKTSAKISWHKIPNATRYIVYRCAEGEQQYLRVAVVAKNSYTDKSLTKGKKYRYKVCSYTGIDGQEFFSEFSSVKTVKTYTLKPKKISVQQAANKSVQLTWNPVKDASGYVIYRREAGNKKYSKIATVTGTLYYDTNIVKGTKYYYRIKTYQKCKDGKIYSVHTKAHEGMYGTKPVENVTAKALSNHWVKVSWSKAYRASRYRIYASETVSGNYKYKGNVSSSKLNYRVKGLEIGKTYYFRVIAVRDENNISVKSSKSSFATAIVK